MNNSRIRETEKEGVFFANANISKLTILTIRTFFILPSFTMSFWEELRQIGINQTPFQISSHFSVTTLLETKPQSI